MKSGAVHPGPGLASSQAGKAPQLALDIGAPAALPWILGWLHTWVSWSRCARFCLSVAWAGRFGADDR
jgi:hypothetical protein